MLTAYAASATTEAASETASQLSNLIELVITKIPLWIAAGIIIFLSLIIAKIARRIVENKLAEKGIEEEHKEVQILMGRMVNSGIQIVGITVGLKIAGIDLTTIIAAVAFGIGFALKDLIINFLAGIMILMGREFAIGDFINIGGTVGKVVNIKGRVTVLQAIDGTKVIVPNADLFKKQVTSFTSNPFRRVEVVVTIDFRNSLKNATRICMKILKTTKGVLAQPKPGVVVGNFTDRGIELKIRAWVDSKGGFLKVKSRLVQSIKEQFDEHGIRIPWPIKTIVNDKDQEIVEKIMEEEEIKEKEAVQVALGVTPAVDIQPPAPTLTPAVAVAGAGTPAGSEAAADENAYAAGAAAVAVSTMGLTQSTPQPTPQAAPPQEEAHAPEEHHEPPEAADPAVDEDQPLKPLGEA